MFIDTCFCIDVIREKVRGQAGPGLNKLKSLGDTELYISLFSACELRAGAMMSQNSGEELKKVEALLEFLTLVFPDVSFPVIYGETEAQLRKQGRRVPVMDLLIGVTAKTFGMPLLTKDVNHFSSIPGLVVESY